MAGGEPLPYCACGGDGSGGVQDGRHTRGQVSAQVCAAKLVPRLRRIGAIERTGHDLQVDVRIDQAGHDARSLDVEGGRALRRHVGPDGGDATVAHEDGGAGAWRRARPVDQAPIAHHQVGRPERDRHTEDDGHDGRPCRRGPHEAGHQERRKTTYRTASQSEYLVR